MTQGDSLDFPTRLEQPSSGKDHFFNGMSFGNLEKVAGLVSGHSISNESHKKNGYTNIPAAGNRD